MKMNEIVSSFLGDSNYQVEENFSGHINNTFFITDEKGHYVLQKINTAIFTEPEVIIENMLAVAKHLEKKNYDKPIIKPLKNKEGQYLTYHNDECWRMIPFFEESQNFMTALNAEQAEAAAECLSDFHAHTYDLDVNDFQEPIVGFINFKNRLTTFQEALENASPERKETAKEEIKFLQDNQSFLDEWIALVEENALPARMIHADPKISNYLFKEEDEMQALALIDWDTLMPGTILYDFGDMVRSFTNQKEEDDPTLGNVFSSEYYEALKKGFLANLSDKLEAVELENLDLAAKTVIYVQAMRFLTDYLNGDVYYKTHRPNQNLDRTRNQIHLLQGLMVFLG